MFAVLQGVRCLVALCAPNEAWLVGWPVRAAHQVDGADQRLFINEKCRIELPCIMPRSRATSDRQSSATRGRSRHSGTTRREHCSSHRTGLRSRAKKDRAVLATLLHLALRRGELCTLTVRDFRHERRGVARAKAARRGGPLHPAAHGLIVDHLAAEGAGWKSWRPLPSCRESSW